MRNRTRTTPRTCCALVLWAFAGFAKAAAMEPPSDIHGLDEVRHLSKLPRELAGILGWQDGDKDRIADLEREPATQMPRSFDRWFVLGGIGNAFAILVVEERAGYHTYDRVHANAFSKVGSDWVPSGEWILNSRPHTVDDLQVLLHSPESQALTMRWKQWQREQDLTRRIVESDPTLRYRQIRGLREINISDEEVREIEAVVHGLAPGAIVVISGVARGCPCEDGPGCSAQVWTAIERSERIRSLELSEINDHWVIGPVQSWYLESAQLARSKNLSSGEYAAALEELNNRFPTCASGPSNAAR